MRNSLLLGVALALVASPGAAQSQSDIKREIESLVLEYSRLEDAMDMGSQFNLIAEDRVWAGIGGRRTDNAMWMKVQQERFDGFKEAFPNVKVYREVLDLLVQVLGDDVAVANFTWRANRVLPGDLPLEKVEALGRAPVPNVVTLVWERQGGNWQIVNSHISPLFIR